MDTTIILILNGYDHPHAPSQARIGSTTGTPPGPVAAAACHSPVGRRPAPRSGIQPAQKEASNCHTHPRLAKNNVKHL